MEHKTHNMEHRTQKKEHRPRITEHAPCSVFCGPSRRGFALLFAIIASSVLLSIGLGIWNIAFKELLISSYGRESQIAFYVADSAIECALYHDFIGTNVFPTSSDSILVGPKTCNNGERLFGTFMCAGVLAVPLTLSSCDSQNAISTFTINLGTGKAIVRIGKSDPGRTGRSATNIESHGQNSTTNYNPTLVERGLRSTY